MSALVLPTRRVLLRDLGRAGLAILVLGSAACAGDSTGNATPTEDSGPSESGTAPTSGLAPTTAPHTSSESSSQSTTPTAGHEWHRANLGFVSAYILYRGGEAAIVDTGIAASEGAIESALAEVGLGWGSVGHVIVTHKHGDHQGSLDAVLTAAGSPNWYAGQGDIGQITAISQGNPVGDGDKVFDLDIISTPGHTPGHISVLDQGAGVLVSGDALNGTPNGVAGANPQFSEDMGLANASIAKLAEFDFEVVLFGHGEPILVGGSTAVGDLAASLG